MFYSQCLLSRKGPLGAIWVAGYCFKRLKKRQVTDTDIPFSVDKILLEGLPSVTYRILAYLLLGVVRIYSKKVEYIFQDCHETVCDINRFSVGKKVVPFRDIVRSSHSITLPERYELDAFRLEVADDASGGNIAQTQDIILQDAGKGVLVPYTLDKHHFQELPRLWDENYDAQSSAGVTMQLETCSSSQTPDKVASRCEIYTVAHTPPDKVPSPHRMEIDMEVSSPNHMKNFETKREKLRELSFTQEEHMNIDMICESDVELLNLINNYQVQRIDDGEVDALEKAPLENHQQVILEEKEVASAIEKTRDSDILEDKEVAFAMEKTRDSETDRNAADATAFELLAVPTPAKENIQRPSKRKCVLDETLVLDNEVMKHAIKDASFLVCKRRKAPHTVIDIWRFSLIPTLSKNFLEPLIPCAAALELQHVHLRKKMESTGSSSAAAETVGTAEAPVKPRDAVSPRTPTDSRLTIAPGTPMQCPASARVSRSPRTADSDGEGPVRSYENLKELSVYQEEDQLPNLMDEVDANEGDSQELYRNKNEFSVRTRNVASYLHRMIHKKKQQEKEDLPLLPILERKTREENARFFFEILVLTSQGMVSVTQEKAYGDVLLQETTKMEEKVFHVSSI